MPFEEMVKQVTETIQKEGNAKAVFGEPTKLDTHVVIPVASIVISVGGGGGGASRKPVAEIARFFGGGGGGVDVVASPVGFIHERDGAVVFTRIDRAGEEERAQHLPPLAEKIASAFTAKAKSKHA